MTSATQGPVRDHDKDLVETLRHGIVTWEVTFDAADTIERLRAEVERLQDELTRIPTLEDALARKDISIANMNLLHEQMAVNNACLRDTVARKDAALRELVAAQDNLIANRRVPFNERAPDMQGAQSRLKAAWAAARAEKG